MHDAEYQSGQDGPRGNTTENAGVLVCVEIPMRETLGYLVRESLSLLCNQVVDCEREGQWEDGIAAHCAALALYSRISVEIDSEGGSFWIAPNELEPFRAFLRDALAAAHQDKWDAESGDVMTLVRSDEQTEVIDALALQVGGLY